MTVPLQEPTFLILAALAEEPAHGYGITQAVAAMSGNRVKLRPGTLYGALDRLVEQALVEPDREEVVDGRLRRYYRLTDAGAGLLGEEAQRLAGNAKAAMAGLRRRSRAAQPETAEPETAEPGSTKTGSAKTGSAHPGSAEPGSAEPQTAQPPTARPGSTTRPAARPRRAPRPGTANA